MAKPHVLIVEDEADIAGLIKHTLERSGDADALIVGSGDAARIRAAALPRAEQESRRVARPAARARLGLRAAGGNTVGGRTCRPAADEAAHRRAPDRNRDRPRLSIHRLTPSAGADSAVE